MSEGNLTVCLKPTEEGGSNEEIVGVDCMLWAIGRDANAVNLGLQEAVSVTIQNGGVFLVDTPTCDLFIKGYSVLLVMFEQSFYQLLLFVILHVSIAYSETCLFLWSPRFCCSLQTYISVSPFAFVMCGLYN